MSDLESEELEEEREDDLGVRAPGREGLPGGARRAAQRRPVPRVGRPEASPSTPGGPARDADERPLRSGSRW